GGGREGRGAVWWCRIAWSCRLRDGAPARIVDDERAVEPGDGGLGAVELGHALAPFAIVDALGRLPRFPEIDAARSRAVLGADVVFADQSGDIPVFRRARLEASRRLGERDRRWQTELDQGGDHGRTSGRRYRADAASPQVALRQQRGAPFNSCRRSRSPIAAW